MSWLVAALLSSMFFAWVTVLDKKLLTDLFDDVSDFFVIFGLMQLVIGPAFIVVALTTGEIPLTPDIWWAVASGLAFAGGLSLFFSGLRIEEATRAVPIMALAPVFATLIGVTLLGESLTGLQWAAIAVVIAGAALVSMRREDGALRIARGRAFYLLLAGAAVIGTAFVVTKVATDTMSVWAVEGISTLVLGIAVLLVVLRTGRIRRIPTFLHDTQTVGVMLLTEGLLAPAAVLTLIIALSKGPVSLVSVITASRPLLVLLISIALSTPAWNILREPLDRETLGLKAFSTVLIVGGVIALAL
ncbi:MAG: EamA family transporter [Chloroflexi bacterium]|nr:EamA family transporter [Chloroflexota bacterium]